jgi:hypothetical protein
VVGGENSGGRKVNLSDLFKSGKPDAALAVSANNSLQKIYAPLAVKLATTGVLSDGETADLTDVMRAMDISTFDLQADVKTIQNPPNRQFYVDAKAEAEAAISELTPAYQRAVDAVNNHTISVGVAGDRIPQLEFDIAHLQLVLAFEKLEAEMGRHRETLRSCNINIREIDKKMRRLA